MSIKNTTLLLIVLLIGIGDSFYTPEKISQPLEEVLVLPSDEKEVLLLEPNPIKPNIEKKTAVRVVKKENNQISRTEIKTYQEVFQSLDKISQVDVMVEEQELSKMKLEVEALLSQADTMIEKEHLIVDEVEKSEEAQASLEAFETEIHSLNTQMEALNHAL